MQGTEVELLDAIEKRLLKDNLVQPGKNIVIMGSMSGAIRARTNFVKLHHIKDH